MIFIPRQDFAKISILEGSSYIPMISVLCNFSPFEVPQKLSHFNISFNVFHALDRSLLLKHVNVSYRVPSKNHYFSNIRAYIIEVLSIIYHRETTISSFLFVIWFKVNVHIPVNTCVILVFLVHSRN